MKGWMAGHAVGSSFKDGHAVPGPEVACGVVDSVEIGVVVVDGLCPLPRPAPISRANRLVGVRASRPGPSQVEKYKGGSGGECDNPRGSVVRVDGSSVVKRLCQASFGGRPAFAWRSADGAIKNAPILEAARWAVVIESHGRERTYVTELVPRDWVVTSLTVDPPYSLVGLNGDRVGGAKDR